MPLWKQNQQENIIVYQITKITTGQCNKKNHSFHEQNGFLTWHY